MNKTELITDAREQLKLARENLAAGQDSLAIGNLYNATMDIARFSGCLQKNKAPEKKPRGAIMTRRVFRRLTARGEKA